MTNFSVSETLIEAIKKFEGCRLESYVCPAGKLTIGVGHTRGVKKWQKITMAQADSLLRGDLLPVANYVNGLGVCKTQGQFDALVDFSFNLGTGALGRSTLLKKIMLGASTTVIQSEFKKWVNAGGKRLPGLVRRRNWEARRWAE